MYQILCSPILELKSYVHLLIVFYRRPHSTDDIMDQFLEKYLPFM